MKSLILCLTLAVLPVFGQPGATLAPIALYTSFQQVPPPAVLAAVRAEVQAIMTPIGFTFEWRDFAAADGARTSVELAVLTFKGRCDLSRLERQNNNPGALGWTHISDGVILPFAEVDCDAVRGYLQNGLSFERPEDRELIFGRALGRVLAHELYHIFANTTHHGSDGVGRPTYSVQDLVAPCFHFAAGESKALRSSPAHAALANAAASFTPDDADNTSHRQ